MSSVGNQFIPSNNQSTAGRPPPPSTPRYGNKSGVSAKRGQFDVQYSGASIPSKRPRGMDTDQQYYGQNHGAGQSSGTNRLPTQETGRSTCDDNYNAHAAVAQLAITLENRLRDAGPISPPERSPPPPPTLPDYHSPRCKGKEGNGSHQLDLLAEKVRLQVQLQELNKVSAEWKEKAAKYDDCEKIRKRLEADVKEFDETTQMAMKNSEELKKENDELVKEKEELKKTIADLQTKNGMTSKETRGRCGVDASLQTDENPAQYERQILDLKKEIHSLKAANMKYKHDWTIQCDENKRLVYAGEEAEARNTRLELKEKQSEKRILALNEKIDKLEKELAAKEEVLKDIAVCRDDLKNTVEMMKKESVHRSKYEHVKKEREGLRAQLTGLRQSMETTKNELDENKKKLSEASAGNDVLVKSWKELQSLKVKLPASQKLAKEMKQEISTLRTDAMDTMSAIVESYNETKMKIIDASSRLIQSLQKEQCEVQEELQNANEKLETLESEYEAVIVSRDSLETLLHSEEGKVTELNQKLASMNTKYNDLSNFVSVLKDKLAVKNKELEKTAMEKAAEIREARDTSKLLEGELQNVKEERKGDVESFRRRLEQAQMERDEVRNELEVLRERLDKGQKKDGPLETTHLLVVKEEIRKEHANVLEKKEAELHELIAKIELLEKDNNERSQELREAIAVQELAQGNLDVYVAQCIKQEKDLRELRRQYHEIITRCSTLDRSNAYLIENEKQRRVELDRIMDDLKKCEAYKTIYRGALQVAAGLQTKINELIRTFDPDIHQIQRQALEQFYRDFANELASAHRDSMPSTSK